MTEIKSMKLYTNVECIYLELGGLRLCARKPGVAV